MRKLQSSKVGKLIGKGKHYKVMAYGDSEVVKFPTTRFENYSKRPLVEKQHYKILKEFLGKQIPKTRFLLDNNKQLVVQRYIDGTSLKNLTQQKMSNKTLESNLIRFLNNCLDLHNKSGMLPEIFGKRKSVLTTDNILVNKKGEVFYVDLFVVDKERIKYWELNKKITYYLLLIQIKLAIMKMEHRDLRIFKR